MKTLLLALALLASAASADDDAKLRAGVFEPARVAPDFSLRGSDAAELRLSRYRGKLVILAFGFSSCSDVCPATLAVLAEARRKLGAEGKDVQVIYVTVDPAQDDAKRCGSTSPPSTRPSSAARASPSSSRPSVTATESSPRPAKTRAGSPTRRTPT
jgi:cytochrome oxidase Cu insertion factor (SCO1/SenC/PrrC family)